jgi:DNA-binding PadR family transcriptional regulator
MRHRGFAFAIGPDGCCEPGSGTQRHRHAWGFAFDPENWFRRGPRGGRRRRVWFESGDMKYVILNLLRDKPMHGYEVMKALEEHTQGCYKPSPGTVYPTLQWLEDEGLVKCEEQDGKKIYSITEAGVAFLEEHKSTVDDIFDRIDETIDSLMSDPIPEVTRLVGKLVTHTYRATWRLREDEEKRKKVKEVLDRAVKELEEMLEG